MVRLLGRSTSGNVQKVMFLLAELDIEFHREDYGKQFGNTGKDDYLAMNPNGKVPTLVDGDLVIWESHSILRYLAAKCGSPLYPEELAGRSQVDRWMDWLLASLNGAYVSAFKANKAGDLIDEGTEKELLGALSLLEAHLAHSDYMAGRDFSIADIAFAPIVARCLNFPIDLPALPALRAWQERLIERPAYQTAIVG